jgi:hypothetical protein
MCSSHQSDNVTPRNVRRSGDRRPHIPGSRDPGSPAADIGRAFKAAWEAKDIDAIIGLLDADATAIADGGGLAINFLSPVPCHEPLVTGGYAAGGLISV